MLVSYRWLQEYVKTTTPPLQLGERFQMTSSVLDRFTDWSVRLEKVVTGRVTQLNPHPQSDRLKVAEVEVGNKVSHIIVCGGDNLEEGQVVLVALPGATLYPVQGEPVTIQEREVRGVVSRGMICAAEEIGIPISHGAHGIWVLPEGTPVGIPATKALQLDDAVLDLEITPNRPDLLSYLGLAREVATFEKRLLHYPEIATLEERTQNLPELVRTNLTPGSGCRRLSALCFKVEQIGPSPWWMQVRLILSGIRPINAIVDITNYVMLELGQPLHAYDFDILAGKEKQVTLTASAARGTETLNTLDGQVRTTAPGDILIVSKDKPVGLAGIMGGQSSSISATTKYIILEAATFEGPQIRRTSRRLGLRSEASGRFEKGLDPELTIPALKRAAYLLHELGTATPASQLADSRAGRRQEPSHISISSNRITELLGVRIAIPEARTILQKLGFQVTSTSKTSLTCIPPTWRADITLEEDVLEELLRIWGYDRIPHTLPTGAVKPPQPNPRFEGQLAIRNLGSKLGFTETVHLPFTSAQELARLGLDLSSAVPLSNPLSSEQSHLIPTHLANFLSTVSAAQQEETSRFFEIGTIFSPPYTEQRTLSAILRGGRTPEDLLREAKRFIEQIPSVTKQGSIPITYTAFEQETLPPYLESNGTCQILLNGKSWGLLGLVRATSVSKAKIRRGREVIFATVNLDLLNFNESHYPTYQPLPNFPESSRDITLVLPLDIPWGKVADTLNKLNLSPIVRSWYLKDTFTGAPLESSQKSFTIHFTYGASDRTLAEAEIDTEEARIKAALDRILPITNNE